MPNGKYILDTNIVIDFLNEDRSIVGRISSAEQIYISVVTVGELLYGAYYSKSVNENIQKIKQFVSNCIFLNIDDVTAENYAKINTI